MGAPANSQINYSAPRVAAQNITTPSPSLNVNEVLGLQSSPYSGLQQVGGQNLYYGDGGFYESYSPEPVRYYQSSPFGTIYYSSSPYGLGGGLGGPSYSPIFGYSGGWQRGGGDVAGTIRRDNQAFKPYTGDIPTGFVETDEGIYEPSMAYVRSQTQPVVTAQPNRLFSVLPGYQSAVGNLLASLAYSGTSGAGQYLKSGSPTNAINFGTPSGNTAA
jgi:hypothetical protein